MIQNTTRKTENGTPRPHAASLKGEVHIFAPSSGRSSRKSASLRGEAAKNCAGILAVKRICYAPQQACRLKGSFLPSTRRGSLRYHRAHFASHWAETSAVSFHHERKELDVSFATTGFGVEILSFEFLVMSPHANWVLSSH